MRLGVIVFVSTIVATGGLQSTRPASVPHATAELPGVYSTQFENEWVRVVRVHYAPHARLPAHRLNSLPAAYVYLNDSGPVHFKHIGTSYGAATRPPTKTGGVRLYRGLEEVHEVENDSPLPSDFLRIELKTDAKDPRTLTGKFFPEAVPAGENLEKVQFENGQIRLSRVVIAAGRSVRLSSPASEPSLLIALVAAQLREGPGGDVEMRPGQERWVAAGSIASLENRGPSAAELLRFELKTRPR
jgi:hypothetical protein